MTTAVYPGRFDPLNLGHLDIMQRASKLFDQVIVAVFARPERPATFTADERVEMIREASADLANIEVTTFGGLTVDFVKERGAQAIVRGLRKNADFEARVRDGTHEPPPRPGN